MSKRALTVVLFGLLSAGAAWAQVEVVDAWARASLPQQTATGAFMTIHGGGESLRLVAVTSPLAAAAEIHHMSLHDGIARMGRVPAVDVPPDGSLELRPGGYHVMLLDLKRPLGVGEKVPLELVFEAADGVRRSLAVEADVRPLNAMMGERKP